MSFLPAKFPTPDTNPDEFLGFEASKGGPNPDEIRQNDGNACDIEIPDKTLPPPFTFLCWLAGAVKTNVTGLELTVEDKVLFADLQNGVGRLNATVKGSQSRKKTAELEADHEEDTTQGLPVSDFLTILGKILGANPDEFGETNPD
ncbi:hypothetical protein B0H10DRAFT_1962048 [Mycena sp. CBHHK59/15]|nr:hypothetical protein B0H10DRAFT_1967838 [Mycena sp. CBHHK59/15]KAJ6583698.1 hypothetical protein B0H10DRAFT_1962048 [Mycena sp. CBHHK59/15]